MVWKKLREAIQETGLSDKTLRKYADDGHIRSKRTPTGQRLFDVESWVNGERAERVICYARVSSQKQRHDLTRQVEALRATHQEAELVQDVGSGLNFKRKWLRAILERSMRGEKLTVVVAHRDRLCRFGFELVSWVLQQNDGKVVVLSEASNLRPTQELTQDLLSVLGVFAARMHGLRKYRGAIKEDPNLSKSGEQASVSEVDRDSAVCVQQDR